MKTIHKSAYLFLIFYLLFFGLSCELFDEKSCDYTRDEIKVWQNGHLFGYDFDDSSFSGIGDLEKIGLGYQGAFLTISNICTSEPVVVSVNLETKNGALDNIYKAYLLIGNEFDNQRWSYPRAVTLARPDIGPGSNNLVINDLEIPAFPNFHSDEFAGSIRMGVLINIIDLTCHEDDAHLVAENWLNHFIEKATITVSYTEY